LAVGFAIAGVLYSPMLLVIAVFVWMGAGREASGAVAHAMMKGAAVIDAMARSFRILPANMAIGRASQEAIADAQREFPVTEYGSQDEPLLGMVTADDLAEAARGGRAAAPVRSVARPLGPAASEEEALMPAIERWQLGARARGALQTMPVVRAGRVVGLLTKEDVGRWLSMRAAARKKGAARAAEGEGLGASRV
jgi:CBS domain-containing protein